MLLPMQAFISNPVGAAEVSSRPEFCDSKGGHQLYALSRTHLYNLAEAGLIKSVCIRRPGAIRGRRLFCCQSIRDFLRANIEEAK